MSVNNPIFAIANQKGGVGKTTTAVNLAASFGVSERRTLLIDLDPQGNASSAFGIRDPHPQLYDGLCRGTSAQELVRPTELAGLDIIPSGKDLVGAEVELVSEIARENRLASLLAPIRTQYELVLIDCPPSLGLLTLNGLTAASRLLVPLQAEYYALEGLAHLLETVERVRRALNPELALEGILLTMFDGRVNLGNQVVAEVRNHFGDLVLRNVIPRNVRLSEAPSFGKPAILYDARSAGAQAYLRVAAELLERLHAGLAAPVKNDAVQAEGASSTASSQPSGSDEAKTPVVSTRPLAGAWQGGPDGHST